VKLVIQNSARVWGGNEKWMLTVAAGLLARGHDVVVSCRAGGEVARRLEGQGIRVSPVRPGVLLDLVHGPAFARWLRGERPDAVLLTSWKSTFWGARAGRRAAASVVVRLGIVRAPARAAVRLAFRRWVDAVIVNSVEIRQLWESHVAWFPAERIHVVLNGVPQASAHRAAAAARLRGEIAAAEDTFIVCGAGHVSRRKGFDILLDAFARAALPDALLVIVGSGPILGELQRQAEAAGIGGRVCWLGQRGDVGEVLAGCDLFVLSSRNEGMANVMLEALAAGTPVVAADVSGVRTALGPDDASSPGWIVPPEDPAAMASAIRNAAGRLRGDPGAAAGLAALARRRVEERFGVERMVAEVEAVLFAG